MTNSEIAINEPATKRPFPPLEAVLTYENPDVVDGLLKSLDIEEDEAKTLFKEGLKWLWYCNHPETKGYRSIDNAVLIIDEVWHTFILYTPYYHQFTKKFFGHYMHHMPTTRKEVKRTKAMSRKDRIQVKRRQYELIYDILGRETFELWYHTFREKYSLETIVKLRKK